MEERERRKCNIMVFNVPESGSHDKEENIIHDKSLVKQILEEIETQANVQKMYRVGDSDGSNARPLKVILTSDVEQLHLNLFYRKLQL